MAGGQLPTNEALYRTLVEQLPAVTYVSGPPPEARLLYVSPHLESLLGYTPEEWVGQSFAINAHTHPDDLARIVEADARVFTTLEPFKEEFRMVRRDGRIIWVSDSAVPILDEHGAVRWWQGVLTDITEQKRLELELRDSQQLFQAFMDNSPGMAFIKDETGRYLFANSSVRRQYPFGPEGVIGKTAAEWIRPEMLRQVAESDERILATGKPDEILLTSTAPDGTTEHWLNIRFPLTDRSGRRLICGMSIEITEQLRLEEELRRSQERFQAFMNNSPTVATIKDRDGRYVYVSPPTADRLSYAVEEVIGRTDFELRSAEIARQVRESDLRVLATGRPEEMVVPTDGPGGLEHWLVLRFRLTDPSGEHFVCAVGVDITERQRLEEELRQQAVTDPLTGLPNRTLFTDRLGQALLRSKRHAPPVAVLFIDLDHFKHINDSLGHAAGDLLLVEAVERLRECLQPTDTLARFGGDEFAILIDGETSSAEVYSLTERLLTALRPPFALPGSEAFIGASIGIAFGSRRHDVGNLLREADIALYEAKAGGRGRVATFEAVMDTRAVQRLEQETALRHAVERSELEVEYQPIVDLATGLPQGCEALVRWNHPERGLLPPGEFLALAEETGSIVQVGEWVLEAACRAAVTWPANIAGTPPFVAVNVSARQLRDVAFGSTLWRVLAETGLPPGRLMLEVTEHALIEDEDATTQFLITLRRLGIRLALDDFGTGYSSLGQLHRLQLDELKIDHSLVKGLGNDRHSIAIVRAVAELARELDLTVTAEGIETPDQQRLARELGCHRGQGYHFGRPVAREAIAEFLAGGGNGKVVRFRRG